MKKIGILGSGTWGTALANLLTSSGHQVTLWSKIEEEIKQLKETHTHRNLPHVPINETIIFTTSLKEAVENQDVVVISTPSIYVRETARSIKDYLNDKQIIVTVAKGIEKVTLMTTSEIIHD